MPNPTATPRIRVPTAPVVDLSELFELRHYSFVVTPDDWRDVPLVWPRRFASRFQPSRAYAAEVDEIKKLLVGFLLSTEQLAHDPYTLSAEHDQFEYESVIRPVTSTFRAKINFQGRSQPLPINDDD
jgi:hypothetical protein